MKHHRANQGTHKAIARSIVAFTILSLFGFYYTSDPLPARPRGATLQDTIQTTDTLYHGFGNEPGWHLLIITGKGGQLNYRLVLDYGEIRLNGLAEEFNSDDYPALSWFVLENDGTPIWAAVTIESCIDESDRDHGTSVELTYKEKKYRGCGSYKE